ncbi:lipid A deacylase LpxR family protein [Rasiella rasia]|uniref:Lipid A deacylase LpxR family protein n=1 Tax=Rasiella rasia TaxID=2744027 RepID=A0A6G6GLR5_9FLAO|nr:lipid A-modifier LpxR family protein [Rasiella rasia]QIE59430.1 lipid A deacylase LpxR family protein [Rasiella rasia]
MLLKFLAHYFYCLCFLLLSASILAQSDGSAYFAEEQVELMHDNDFLHFTDRWYTTGSFISYRKLMNDLDKDHNNKRQFTIQLEQSFYTPSNILSNRIEDYDRPYAGFLGLNNSLTLTNENRMLDFTFTIGVTGEISGSEGLQSWFHSTNESQTAQWNGQIENSTHANLYGSYLREWRLIDAEIDVLLATKPKVALGTKDYFLENQLTLFLGNRNDIESTMAYRQIGTIENELFFALTGSYRYVIHDAMLQGSIIADNSEFVLEPVDSLIFYGAEAYWRTRRMDFKVAYMFSTKRAESTGTHGFSTLSISRNF